MESLRTPEEGLVSRKHWLCVVVAMQIPCKTERKALGVTMFPHHLPQAHEQSIT